MNTEQLKRNLKYKKFTNEYYTYKATCTKFCIADFRTMTQELNSHRLLFGWPDPRIGILKLEAA